MTVTPSRVCSVDGCAEPVRYQRSMCARHLRLLWKYGSTDDRVKEPRGLCSVPGCDRDWIAKRLCGTHYARQRKGLPLGSPIPAQGLPLPDRFWANVERSGDGDCWEWGGSRNNQRGGYGFLTTRTREGKTVIVMAHRLSWELANGRPVPEGLVVRHSCDNPPCVNPAHLSVGTQAENMRDMVERHRSVSPRGELCGKAKLTAAQVLAIRAEAEGGDRYTDIASRYGVSPSHVRSIALRQRWSHI